MKRRRRRRTVLFAIGVGFSISGPQMAEQVIIRFFSEGGRTGGELKGDNL